MTDSSIQPTMHNTIQKNSWLKTVHNSIWTILKKSTLKIWTKEEKTKDKWATWNLSCKTLKIKLANLSVNSQ